MGWGAIAAVTWSSPIIAILIFCILATNIVMLVLKATDTLDVDIWNYHHMAIVGIMVYFVTKNVAMGIDFVGHHVIITFKLSDWTAPLVEDYFQYSPAYPFQPCQLFPPSLSQHPLTGCWIRYRNQQD